MKAKAVHKQSIHMSIFTDHSYCTCHNIRNPAQKHIRIGENSGKIASTKKRECSSGDYKNWELHVHSLSREGLLVIL